MFRGWSWQETCHKGATKTSDGRQLTASAGGPRAILTVHGRKGACGVSVSPTLCPGSSYCPPRSVRMGAEQRALRTLNIVSVPEGPGCAPVGSAGAWGRLGGPGEPAVLTDQGPGLRVLANAPALALHCSWCGWRLQPSVPAHFQGSRSRPPHRDMATVSLVLPAGRGLSGV